MNDVLSQLQKVGRWIWLQKEKMVLLALVVFLFYRVYAVAVNKETPPPPPPPSAANTREVPNPPPFPPDRPPLADAGALVSRNPFTIYGIQQAESSRTSEEVRIPLVLQRIVPWNDGQLRAELTTEDGRSRRYKEGESFQSYVLESIDEATRSVVVYSQEHDRTFTLKAQGGS
jgi:type II secretory pathway component PulC